MTRDWRVFLALSGILAFSSGATSIGQEKSNELTPSIDRTVSPFPPSHVVVKPTRSGMHISWHYNQLDTTARFRVYRIVGDSTVDLGLANIATFVDPHPPAGKVLYQVSVINVYGVESQRSTPVAPEWR